MLHIPISEHNPHFLKSEHKTKLSSVYSVLVTKVLLTTENKTYASNVKNNFRFWVVQGGKKERRRGKCW